VQRAVDLIRPVKGGSSSAAALCDRLGTFAASYAMLTSREIRQKFLDHFAQRGHTIVPSAPMVVKDDPTLMFTNAGMNQFKDLFLGNREAKHKRIADTQKCLRVSGKHNDLEEVGIDTYHHTMFEMLGNWSFGDYFKKEAIQWAWELLVDEYRIDTNGHLRHLLRWRREGRPARRRGDARALAAVPARRPHPALQPKDNFWEMGDTGPCGPCTEIHVDVRTAEEKAAKPGKRAREQRPPTGDRDLEQRVHAVRAQGRWLAAHAARPARGHRHGLRAPVHGAARQAQQLRHRCVPAADPGLGEACGKVTVKEEKADIAMRVIADHLRAISFAIADGQLPSNTGAGYVIRRILRRAVRYGYSFLGFNEPFMHDLVPVLVGPDGRAVPRTEEAAGHREERDAGGGEGLPAHAWNKAPNASSRRLWKARECCPETRPSSSSTPTASPSTSRSSWRANKGARWT
jgi:alanyl-tRNA synthetase